MNEEVVKIYAKYTEKDSKVRPVGIVNSMRLLEMIWANALVIKYSLKATVIYSRPGENKRREDIL